MAVNLFQITVNGTEYIYRNDKTWVDSNGNSFSTLDGIDVDTNKKNSDGTYDVKVSKTAFSTIDSSTKVSITDLNLDDRQTYRLALGSGYTSGEIYGARQTVTYSTSGVLTTLEITGINSGLLVSSGGTSITYEIPQYTTASVVIENLALTNNVTVSGRTIIIGNDALPTGQQQVQISTNDSNAAYSLALGDTVASGKISTYTEAGWEDVTSGGNSARFLAAGYTAGYRKHDDTTLIHQASSGGDALFRVDSLTSGMSAAQLGEYFTVAKGVASGGTANVSLTADGFSALLPSDSSTSKAITITDTKSGDANYVFAIGAGVNTVSNSVTAGLSSDYVYNTGGNSAYANLASSNNTITVYKEVESKSFGLSGLSAGNHENGAVSVVASNNGFTVTLGQSALAKQNIFAYGDYADSVTFAAATGVDTLASTDINGPTASLTTAGVLTYVSASAAKAGYDFQTNQVIYYAEKGAGGTSFAISGITGTETVFSNGIIASSLGTITPEATGASVTTFNIALAQNASTGTGNPSFTITAGAKDSLSYKLTYAGASAYGSKDTPNVSLSSLNASLDSSTKQYTYTYVSQYTPAYLTGSAESASVLSAKGTATYTYNAGTASSSFTLSGLSNPVFGTTELSGADAKTYFTINGTSVTFTTAGKSSLLLGAKDGETLTISGGFSMANPLAIVSHAAGFSGSVTSGAIKFNEAYNESGWSAAKDGYTGSYSSAFVFHQYANQDYAFSLSGLTGLDGKTFTYTAKGGGISFVGKDSKTYAFGTLSYPASSGSGIISLTTNVFNSTITGISSITLTDNDASDSVLYTFALGDSMPAYGVSNMRDTKFTASKIDSAKGVSSYEYVSGGLSDGYGLYLERDTRAGLSAGTTTVTKYEGTPSSTFTISGLSAGIGTAAVLDYVVIDSKEKLEYYVTKATSGETTTYTLRKGNYRLEADITLDYTLTVAAETAKSGNTAASGGNVAIDLNGKTISNAIGSVFNVTGGDLIINGSGSIAATADTSTAIAITKGNLIVNGGEIEGKAYGISATGANSPKIVINGGTINGQTSGSGTNTGTGIKVEGGELIVAGGTVKGGTNAINNSGGMVYVTGGTITGTTVGIGVSSLGSVNVLGGAITGTYGLSVATTSSTVNVLGGSVNGSNYAIINADDTAVNIGKASIGSLSGAAGSFSIFTDYSGTTYATINNSQQTTTGSYSSYFIYSSGFSSIINSVEYPTFSASSAVIVGASAGGYITLNRAALAGISKASLTSAGGYTGLALGSDVTTWDNRTDSTRNTGWFISDATVAGDSSVDKAQYQATHYLESWQVGDSDKSVTRYAETGGATIKLSGLSNIVANGTSMPLTDASLGSLFNVSLTGGTTTSASAVTKYTVTIANNASLLSALDGGESLTFAFNKPTTGTDASLTASGFSLAFADGITLNTARSTSDSVITNNYTHSAVASLTGTGAFLYTASGVEDHYLLQNSTATDETGFTATLTHVDTVGLQQFSLSGLGSKFSNIFASAATTDAEKGSVVYLYGTETGKTPYEIGKISLSGSGDDSIGTVTLGESAFTAGASQKITLTDLNMSDAVYYVLDQGDLTAASAEGAKINQTLKPFAEGGTSYTFILGGSNAFYGVTYSGSAASATTDYPGGTSSSYIQYTPQVGGQSFILTGLTLGLTATGDGNLVSIMSSGTQVGSISFSDRNVIHGNGDSVTALVTLTDVAAMGTNLGSGQSKAFAFKDSDSLDGIEYSLSLGSAFNQVSAKPANPDVEATFSVRGAQNEDGYIFTAPAYNNYTLSKGSGSYVYYAKETADSLNISGLSIGLAANDSVYAISTNYSSGASGITTVSASGTKTGTLFTVERAGGSLNLVVYEGALQSVANRANISVAGGALSSLSFAGTLGQSGVTISAGAFSSTAGGSFTYQAASYQDYYSVAAKDNGTITATHYAGAGGQSFTFSGLSTGDGLTVAGLSSAINVISTSGKATAGGFSITKYTFEVGLISLLNQIPQGQSLAVKSTGTYTGGLSLTIASNIITTATGAAKLRDQYVAGKESLAPDATAGKASFASNSGGSFTYTAKLNYYDWFDTSKGTVIIHQPQDGGQQFSISGIAESLNTDTYSILDSGVVRANLSNDSIVPFMQVKGASVYLTRAAFGSGSTITLTDGYDGAGNSVAYQIVGTTLDGYLKTYEKTYNSAKFASVASASAGTYNFTASGINAGISIATTGKDVTKATYIDAIGSEEFVISGLSAGMSFTEGNFNYSNGTLVSLTGGGASVLKVTGASSAFNVMVYSGALSSGRGDISLTSGTDNVSYSLSLASDLLLVNGAPSILNAGSASITFDGTAASAVWTANTYKDYYSLTSDTFAKHYESSGGQSFVINVTNASGTASIKGTITVVSQSGSLNANNQYELNNVVFGVSKAALTGLLANEGDILAVGTQSGVTYSGNYALSFVGETSDSTYSSDVIMTKSVSTAAKLSSVGAGTYNFSASVGQYDWYEHKLYDDKTITYHEKVGGESFSITGLNTSLGTLTYDATTGQIKSGTTLVGKVEMATLSGTTVKAGNVYLTATAFGSGNATVTLTDLDSTDGISYALKLYTESDNTYLMANGENSIGASFAEQTTAGTYLYTASINGAYGVADTATAETGQKATTLEYKARTGGESFIISGLASSLNATVDADSNVISNNVTIGTVSLTSAAGGSTGWFTLKSPVALGTFDTSETTKTIILTDKNTSDDVDYKLTLGSAFNFQSDGKAPTASVAASIKEEGTNTGTYDVQVGGISAWSETYLQDNYSYLYHKAQDATTYVVAGLQTGLGDKLTTAAALSAVFGVSSVKLNDSVIPDSVTTVQILNYATPVTLTTDSTIAEKALQSKASGTLASANYQAQTYKPWYKGSTGGASLKIYPSVGGETFQFTGLDWNDTKYNYSGSTIVNSKKGTITATVDYNIETGKIDKYIFTVGGSVLASNLSPNDTISVTRQSGSASYALDLSGAIKVGTGSAVTEASLVSAGSQKRYIGTGVSEHVEASASVGGLTTAYTYHESISSVSFYINNLKNQTLGLGSDVIVQENWSGDSLSSVGITLTSGALAESTTNEIYTSDITGGKGSLPASIVAFALSAGTLAANSFGASFAGTGGSYYYRRSGQGKGYYVSDDKSKVQYSSVASGGQSFTLTGLSTDLGSLSVVSGGGSLYAYIGGQSVLIGSFVGDQISITSASALGNRTVTLTDYVDRDGETFDYKLSIAKDIQTVAGTSSVEKIGVDAFGTYEGKLYYTAAVSSATYTGSTSTATGTASVGAVKTQHIYTYTPPTKLGYDFYFDGGFNSSEYNDTKYGYSVKDGVITATKSDGTGISLATIAGGISGTISIGAAAFGSTSTPLFLTYTGVSSASAGYKLALGSGMSAAISRSESFKESSTGTGHYSYEEAGNNEGYAVISYSGAGGGSAIAYTSQTGGNNFDLSGLKGGMSLSVVDGNIIDGKTNTTIGTYETGSAHKVILYDNALDYSSITAGHSVVLSNVSNEYDTKFGIGKINISIVSDSVNMGTDYAFNGASFTDAQSTSNGYSIIYQANAKDAYWRTNGTVNKTKSYTYMPTVDASPLFSLGSFSTSVTGSDFTVNGGNSITGQGTYAVNVADSLLPNADKQTITLTDSDTTDSYNFYFAAGDGQDSLVYASGSSPASVLAGFDSNNVFTADYRRTYTSIGSASRTLVYVPAAGGESFSITGLAVNLSLSGTDVYASINGAMSKVGTLASSGETRTLTLTTTAVLGSSFANGQSVAITLTDLNPNDSVKYALSLGDEFNLGGTSVRADVLKKDDDNGSYTYKVGALSAYTTTNASVAGSVTSYTYYADTSSEDFSITGLSVGLTGTSSVLSDANSLAAYFRFSGQSVTITDKTFAKTEGKTITFNGDADGNGTAYSLVNPDERETLAPNFEGTGNAILYRDTITTAGFSGTVGEQATLTYAASVGGDTLFTVSGLSSTFNATGMSYSVIGGEVVAGTSTTIGAYAGNTFTLNKVGLSGAKGTVSISGTAYNLALAGVGTESAITPAKWVDDSAGGVSYVTASNDAYWNPVTANKAYTYVPQSGGETVFGIHGLSATADDLSDDNVQVASASGVYSVTVTDDVINKTAGATVSVTGSNELYFEGDISVTTAAGYSSLKRGSFNSTTYSIPAYSDQMIAVDANKKNAYYFAEGSSTAYVFGITGGADFNDNNFDASLISGGDSVLFTYRNSTKPKAARLDKTAKTVKIYSGIFGNGEANGTVKLTNTDNLVIASGDLTTTPRKATNSQWGNYGSTDLLYLAGLNTNPYFSKTDDKTLTYVSQHGGDYFQLNNPPASLTIDSLNAGAISVSTNDGANYVFTISNQELLSYAVSNKGFSVAVRRVGTETNKAGLSLSVAFAASNANNEPVKTDASLTAVTGGFRYTAVGTEEYYKNTTKGSHSTAWASLSYVEASAGESFIISGLTNRSALNDAKTAIVVGTNTLAGISFTGNPDTETGRYKGNAYVYLTEAAFRTAIASNVNQTISVVDSNLTDAITYGLSYGDGTTYLAKVGDYKDETFDKTDNTYNYSASTREQGITIKDNVAAYSASAGYGNTFSITNLAGNLTVKGGNALAGTATVGTIKDGVFTLTSLSALSAAAQDFGATTTFTLTNTGTATTYSLSVADDLAVGTAKAIGASFAGVSGVYTYAAAHSGAYVSKAADNSYTFNAEEKHDTFELSGNGLAASLSLGSLSISGMNVTLLDTAINASASAGDTIVFNGDKDGNGTAYTIAALSTREDIPKQLKGTGTAITYFDDAVSEGWSGAGGSTATFTYSDVTGGASLFTVTGLSATYTGASVSYTIANDGGVLLSTTQIGTFGASTLTLNGTALAGASFVKLEGAGFSLALDQTVAQSAAVGQSGFVEGTRTYYSASIGAYWGASGVNAYTFNAASASAAQFSLSGTGRTADSDNRITGVSYAGVGTVVTINNEALSTANVTLTNLSTATYSLSLGSNVAQSAISLDGWKTDGTKATYLLGAASAYYTKTGDTQIAYHDSVAGASAVILDGVANVDSMSAPANGVVGLTASNFSSNGVTVIKGSESYAFSLAAGDYLSRTFTGMSVADTVNSGGSNVVINVGALNDLINLTAGTGATLTLGDGLDTISVGAGVTEFTVTDFSADDVIVGSFSSIETVDGGIKAGDVVIKGITQVAGISTAWAPSGANISYVSTSTSGATLDDNKITLVSGAGQSSTLFTIFNINSTLGVSLDSMTVTLGQSALDPKTAGTTVSLSGAGYTLALSGVAQSATVIADAGFSGAIYSASAIDKYWSASGTNAYYLNPSVEGAAQFSIAGATALANSIVSGTTVNIGEANLAGTSVTLTNLSTASYALKLDSAVGGASTLYAGFAAVTSNNSASYLGEGNTAGYSQASTTQINYIRATSQSTLFTLTGISNTTGIEPTTAKVVTVAESNVAQNAGVIAVTGTTEYTLAVTGLNTIGTPSTTYTFGTVSNNSASYLSTTTYKDFWTATDERTYTFTAGGGTSTSTLFTIDGIATIENSAVSGTTVTLGEKNFAGMNISLNGAGYSLALDGDYAQSVTAGGFGSLQSGAATYYGEGTSDGYSLTSATQITYAKGQSGAELFNVSNITSTDNVSYAASAITAANESGAKLTLTNLSSALTIGGFVEIESLNATNHTVEGTPGDAIARDSNLIVTTEDGTITIVNAAAQTVNFAGASASYTAAFDRVTDVTDENAKKVTLTAGFTNSYYGLHQSYGKGVTAVDATKANTAELTLTGYKQTDDLTLTGASAAANTVIGGKGNDTITGGGLNDNLKGNAGADVFVQSAGTDTIVDYTENEDTIQLISTLANTAADSLNNVTLNTADGNAIVIENGVGQVIKTVDGTGNADYTLYLPEAPTNASVSGEDLIVTADKDYTFAGAAAATVTVNTADGGTYTAEQTRITDITDENAKKVTLTAGYTNSYYGLHQSYGKGVTAVDATKADTESLTLTGYKQTDDLTLTGASAATNTVIGGKGNDTITGGGLNDSLKGNAGNDLFIQSAGNDTIGDYTENEDTIQLLGSETGRETVDSDLLIKTTDGTILVVGGSSLAISVIGGDSVTSGTPIDSNTDGTDLLVTLAGGTTTTFAGQANDTVTMSADDNSNYSVQADRITDFTAGEDKKVTLTAGFSGNYYGLHQSYGKGVTAVDAAKATAISTLTLTGYKSTDDLTLTGAPDAANTVIGGKGNDTITGGGQNDNLKGNAGNDVFVQSAGNDTIADYTAGEDVISLVSALTSGSVSGNDVILTTEDGNTIQLTDGKGQTITTDYQGTTAETVFSGETVVSGAPVDVTVSGSDLVVTLADDTTTTFAGSANDTVTMSAGDHNYSVQADRITDFTAGEDNKAVTLASGFTNAYYNLNQGYGSGVTTVDATKAASTTLTMTGSKQTADLSLKGSDNVGTNITGGMGNDTLKGGALNDTLNGGSAGNDLFIQSGGEDTVTNYTAGEDKISLGSALTATATDANNVTLTTAEGTIIVRNGTDQSITTVLNDTESTSMFFSSAPTGASVSGDNLVVTTDKGDFTVGGASDTVTMYAGDKTYTAESDRLTDITDANAKSVTLTSGFEKNYYGMHYSYSDGVTTVDATDANTTDLTLTGFKSEVALNLKGADKAANVITGGKGNDTLIGGTGNNSLKGNAGADLFIQNGKTDVILDYAEEDTIQLTEEAAKDTSGNDVTFTNGTGVLTVLNGSGLTINTTVVSDANTATSDDELWGVNGVKDTFLFDGGNDTIHGYEEQDAINLGGFSLSDLVSDAPTVKDNNVIFTFDKKNSFTVTDAVDKTISFTDGFSYSRDKK